MIGPKPKVLHYFDRKIIKTNWKKINRNPLQKGGMLVRTISRGMIKRAKYRTKTGKATKVNPAGQPFKSRAPGAPMKLIFTVPSGIASQIVGIVGFGNAVGGQPIPGLHEHGGTVGNKLVLERTEEFKHKSTRKTHGKFAAKVVKTKLVRKTVTYPARPVMRPALRKAIPKLPELWENSIVGTSRNRAA